MFGSVDIKTRPLRIAYLVEPNNSHQVREAIRLSSSLWGGDFFPIIPLYKRMPSTWREKPFKISSAQGVIKGYIEAFDPDIFVQFSKEIPKFISDIGLDIIKPEEIWSGLKDDKNLSSKFGLGVFEILDDIFEKNFKFKMKYPIEIVFPKIPRQYSLFWASWFGEFPSEVIPYLKADYIEHLEVKSIDLKLDNIKQLLSSNKLFPRRITHHLIKSYRGRFGRDAHIYYLDATKVEDIVDFWNLRAIGKAVLPLPKQLKDELAIKEVVTDFLKTHHRPWPNDSKVFDCASIVRSRNSNMEEVKEYVKTLNIKDLEDGSNGHYFSLQHWYPRVWDEWARDKDGAVPTDIFGQEEESIEFVDSQEPRIRFKPLLPKFAYEYSYHGKPRCANEISFRFYGENEYIAEVFPKSCGENFIRTISSLTSFKREWRVGRNGLVNLIKDNFTETIDIPFSENVFFSWLKDMGWSVTLSSAGLLAKQIHKKLGAFVGVLINEKLLGLLEHMNGGTVKRDGNPVIDNKITQERDLAIGEVKKRLIETGKNNLHDFLVEKGVFKIGLRVKCVHCLRSSWFALEDIREKFVCPRCLNTFPAIGNIDNSLWSYKTAGPFSVPNYADGAYSVLLTTNFFNDQKMTTMRTTPTLSFIAETPSKINIEADIGAFWQESIFGERKTGILFCECKTYGLFQKTDFDRMRYLANTFPGAILVFSTLRRQLNKKEIIGITKIAKAGRKYWKPEIPINPVLVLTGNELLNHFGPPFCWEDSIQKRFNHVNGLISLCDATQQLYLNLPSWHADWQKKWEQKNKKRISNKKNMAIPIPVNNPTQNMQNLNDKS